MLKNLEDSINKTCLIGLTYFSVKGEQLKQTLLAGTVISVDKEMGITIALLIADSQTNKPEKAPEFILPANLSCWFNAPKGDYHTSHNNVKITDPNFLVTWDIYQTTSKDSDNNKEESKDGEQQWWEWHPRTADPTVNKQN